MVSGRLLNAAVAFPRGTAGDLPDRRLSEIVASHPSVRVVMVQDYHTSVRIKRFVSSDIADLSANGITHYCFEVIPNFDLKYLQDLIDNSGAESQKACFSHLMGVTIGIMRDNIPLQVVGIDHPSVGTGEWFWEEAREKHMFSSIMGILGACPENRLVVHVGASHAAPRILRLYNYNPEYGLQREKVYSVAWRLLEAGLDLLTVSFPETSEISTIATAEYAAGRELSQEEINVLLNKELRQS